MLFDDPVPLMVAPKLFERSPFAVRQIAAGVPRCHMSPDHGPGAARPFGGSHAAIDSRAFQKALGVALVMAPAVAQENTYNNTSKKDDDFNHVSPSAAFTALIFASCPDSIAAFSARTTSSLVAAAPCSRI